MGHREPGRSDIKENIRNAHMAQAAGVQGNGVSLRPEKMVDVEIGYSYTADRIAVSANVYLMEYWDMLLETGRLTDVGNTIKENVDRSWRRGVELAAGWQALPWLHADANLTLSTNMIKDYTEYIPHIDSLDDWNETGVTTPYTYQKTRMLMSPSVSGMARLAFAPFVNVFSNSLKTTTLAIDGKYVGKQFLDNTMAESRSIPAYFVSNLSLTHEFSLSGRNSGHDAGKLGVGFYVNNLFNNMYYADGWCWKNIVEEDGSLVDGIGIYPQAPVNFMLKVTYLF